MRIRIRNNGLTHSLTQPLRSDRTPADGVSVHCLPVLRSRHFLGRLRLWMAKVPEPTQVPTYLGRLRLQAKKGRLQAAPAPYTNNFHFKLSKS